MFWRVGRVGAIIGTKQHLVICSDTYSRQFARGRRGCEMAECSKRGVVLICYGGRRQSAKSDNHVHVKRRQESGGRAAYVRVGVAR